MSRLLALLTPTDKRRLTILFAAVVGMAVLELGGIASILPFMQLVANPEAASRPGPLQDVFSALGLMTFRQQVVAAGLAVLLLITLANTAAAATMWYQHRTAWRTAHGIATRLVKTYVAQPYEFFLTRNSADLIKKAIAEVNDLVTGVLVSIGDIAAKAVVALVIIGLLVFVNAPLALAAAAVLGLAYVFIYALRQNLLTTLGEERIASNLERFKSLGELLSGIKTIKAYGAQRFFFERYSAASHRITTVHSRFQVISATPRYAIELIAFGAIVLATVYLAATGRRLETALPLLSLFALAAYRLIPALQILFAAIARLRHTWPIVDELHDDVVRPPIEWPAPAPADPLPFENAIRFEGVAFRFDRNDRQILAGVDCVIPRASWVAFVGPTGSGKSTLIDLLVGLIQPTAGSIRLDEILLDPASRPAWQATLAYVPQEVFLYDDTVARNIALGVPDAGIDRSRLQEAARLAQAHTFITTELAQGYDTPVGERGVRLSGGQRQRLGIARALYRDRPVLILDEATSALDSTTERTLIAALQAERPDLTVVLIAHRIDTVRQCDRIYLIEEGKITASGTFDDLSAVSRVFRELARHEPG